MNEHMKYNGVKLPLGDIDLMEQHLGYIVNDFCYGRMIYHAKNGKSYFLPSDETAGKIHERLLESVRTGIDFFARDYDLAPPIRRDVIF